MELPDEVGEERLGAGVGVGLEGAENPAVAQGSGGGEEGMELSGVVGIVVVDIGTVVAALELHPPSRPGEVVQRPGGHVAGDPGKVGGGTGSQGVHGIVPARHREGDMGIGLAVADDVKLPPVFGKIRAVDAVFFAHAEGAVGETLQSLQGVIIVAVGDDVARLGHQLGKGAEGVLDVGKILEEIQMVGLDV